MMRHLLVILLLGSLAYAIPNAPQAGGPYDWNNFLLEVSTTCKDVEIRKEQIEKEASTDSTVRASQKSEVGMMLTKIILIQNMINNEFKYRDTLDQAQKNLLETYKNKALRLRQELTALKKSLTYAIPSAPQTGGLYDWNSFLSDVSTTCKDVEIRKQQIEKQVSTDPTVRASQRTEVRHMLDNILRIQNLINNEFKYRDTLDQSQKNLLETYKNKALRLQQELTALQKTLN